MGPFSWPGSSQPLTPADAERLVAGRGAPREAPAVQHALADLLDSAAGPASEDELAGEIAAIAAFVLVTAERGTRSTRFRVPVPHAVAACVAAAVIAAFSGAAADILPAPVQEMAHTTFGAPAPRHPALARKAAHRGARPRPATSLNPATKHGGAKLPGKKAKPAKTTKTTKATAKPTAKAKQERDGARQGQGSHVTARPGTARPGTGLPGPDWPEPAPSAGRGIRR
jgi:hypothetical protein